MASKTAILTVRVVSDVKDAVKGLGDVEDKSKGLEAGLKSAAAPAAGVVAALGAMGKAAFDSASEMQQSATAAESVFGDHAAAVKSAAATAADSVGLAASEYQNMSSILGAQLKNMGTPMDELSGSTQNLIGLGADLAATFGGRPSAPSPPSCAASATQSSATACPSSNRTSMPGSPPRA